MSPETAANVACLLGAAGTACVLVPRSRWLLTAGMALVLAAEILLAWSVVPSGDLGQLTSSAARVGALVVGLLLVAAAGLGLARFPAAAPVALLLAAPFRVPVELGAQDAFLLLPLYAVLAAASLGLLLRLWAGDDPPAPPRLLSLPAAAFVALSAVSLLWSDDLRAGTVELLFFLFPLALLLGVVARTPLAAWSAGAYAIVLVALGCVFTAVGLSQLWTGDLYFAPDLQVSNAYTSYQRTTSLFADSSVYARQLGVAMVVLLTAVYLARVRILPAVALLGLLWAGLFFSYSQSGMVALAVATIAVGLLAADRAGRRALLVGTVAVVVAGGVVAGLIARGDSTDRITSGRAGLVESTWRVFVDHPVVGVGVGSQPKAAREEGGKASKRRNTSHTTPLTVAAELGALGIAAYLAFLVGAIWVLRDALRREELLGIGLAGSFVFLLVHSIFYSAFFEDALTWGLLGTAAATSWEAKRRRGSLLAPGRPGPPVLALRPLGGRRRRR